MSNVLETRDCTDRCKSEEHGDTICAVLTKRGVTDLEICSFLNCVCSCSETVKDCLGRTALHLAASCGRLDVVKWLLNTKHANINAKDSESGYTPLHRSIFYGKINVAVYLLKLGANMTITDLNGLTSLEHAMKDMWLPIKNYNKGEVYVWGSNANYTLGLQHARSLPELLDTFHKEFPQVYVEQVWLEKFHCVLVTADGRAFTSGHGQGGRLGLASEQTVLTPKPVRFAASGHATPILCKKASIAGDHSVFLTDSGHVWTCGLNTHRVLGIVPPPPQLLVPRPLPLLRTEITGICAAKYHTIAWGPKGIFTWGLHGGQLGHDKSNEKYIVVPKSVNCPFGSDTKILDVATSAGATVVATSKGDIYVLHEYQCRKIASRQLNIVSVGVVGGKLNLSVNQSLSDENYDLKVIALTDVGNLFLWQESDQQFSRCIYSVSRTLNIRQVMINANDILFVTNEGEAFEGTIKPRKKKVPENNATNVKKSAFHEFLEKDDCQLLKVTKIPRIHRAISISSDLKGRNFAVLQTPPKFSLTNVPIISPPNILDHFESLLLEADETDSLHDVRFKISSKLFVAHRYIVSLGSDKLSSLITANSSEFIDISNMEPDIFEQLLKYMYTGSCDLIQPGRCPDKFLIVPEENEKPKEGQKNKSDKISEKFDHDNVDLSKVSAFKVYKNSKSKTNIVEPAQDSLKDPVRKLQEAAKRFGIKGLQKILDYYFCSNGYIRCKNCDFIFECIQFNRTLFPNLQDVVINSKDGKKLPAHKCVLVARLEYFRSLFSVRWNQSSEVLLPFPSAILEQLLEFLYTDELPNLENEDMDHICNILIIADQLFVTRLKEICEYTLCKFLTLKNITQMLSFSYVYNAEQLKECCMEFICLNLAAILELHSLESLDEKLMTELTEFYSKFNPSMCQRIITPYSYAPKDELVTSYSAVCPVSLDDSETDINNKSVVKSAQKKRSRPRRSTMTDKKDHDLSISETTHDHGDVGKIENDTVQAITDKEKFKSDIPTRFKAITNAQDRISNEPNPIIHNFTKLSVNAQMEDISLQDFPELNSGTTGQYSKSPGKSDKIDIKAKITKLSQKQRKRLSSESNLIAQESLSPTLSESPKNPWKIPVNIPSPVGSPQSPLTMHSIIIDEKKQKENLVKMRTKLLVFTQMEDKAIEDFYKFYNVDNVFDEVITIGRVQIGTVASPTWVNLNRSK